MNSVPSRFGGILRYILLLSFLFILNLFFLPLSIHAQTPNLVNITLNPTSLDHHMKINDTVTIGVDIDPGSYYKVTGIELKIIFHPDLMELFNTVPSDYLSLPTALQCPNCQPKIENGVYTATFLTGSGASPQSAPGRLVQLMFRAKKESWESRVSVDPTGTNISGYDTRNNPVDSNLLGTINEAVYIIDGTGPTAPIRNCPMYSPPAPGWCSDGTILPGGTDSNGCQLPPNCSKSCNSTCQNDSDCASGYCYQPPYYCPSGQNCPNVMPQKICRERSCQENSSCSCNLQCKTVGESCGIGFAGPNHPIGTCCNGLSCISSNSPDAGGTCQKCYQLPKCVYDNPPCSINVPAGVEICTDYPPKCVNPPPCLHGVRQPDGNMLYCDPQPGILYCPITPPPPPIDCPTHQNGDANCDGLINDRDYRIWEYEMQFSQLPFKRADFNSDGREDMVDFEIWRRNSQGADICTNADKTASMTYDEAKSIAENSICTSEGIIRNEGQEFCNQNTSTWWLPFASLSNSRPGCSPACVVDINTKQAEINWRCTGVITPMPVEEKLCINPPACCNNPSTCTWPDRGYCTLKQCDISLDQAGSRCGWYWQWHDKADSDGKLGTNTPEGYGCVIGDSPQTMHPKYYLPD